MTDFKKGIFFLIERVLVRLVGCLADSTHGNVFFLYKINSAMKNLEFHLLCIQHNQLSMNSLVKQLLAKGEDLSVPKEQVTAVPGKPMPQSFVNSAALARMAGRSVCTCQRWLRDARGNYNLPPRSLVTVEQFAAFRSIPPHVIYKYL
jgi:hypothetical protein